MMSDGMWMWVLFYFYFKGLVGVRRLRLFD